MEAPGRAAGVPPPGRPRGDRETGARAAGETAGRRERGGRVPAAASAPQGSAFRMKSGLLAGGFIGAEHIRDVSSARCRCTETR